MLHSLRSGLNPVWDIEDQLLVDIFRIAIPNLDAVAVYRGRTEIRVGHIQAFLRMCHPRSMAREVSRDIEPLHTSSICSAAEPNLNTISIPGLVVLDLQALLWMRCPPNHFRTGGFTC